MVMVRMPAYERALKGALIEHCLREGADATALYALPESTIFAAWRDAISAIMAPLENKSFADLSSEAQKAYFPSESLFNFARFRNELLAKSASAQSATLH